MKKFKFVIILLVLIVICVTLASCDLLLHTHSYGSDYQKDATHHWKVCKGCKQTKNKEVHSFDEWTVDEEPTETTSGSRHKTCTVCGYEKSETMDPLGDGHKHSYPNVYIPANNFEHFQECPCGDRIYSDHEMSTQYVKFDDTRHSIKCIYCNYAVYYNHNMGDWTVDVQPTTTSEGHKYRECTDQCGYIEEQTIPKLKENQATGAVDFYAINDFHGEYAKLAQISGFISGMLDNGNTVAINSGDMFQGSMESNWNYGKLFAECMDIAGFDAFTFGNHEFDWGLDNLRYLADNSNVPYLGANIYNWNASSKTWGSFADDLAKEYVIKELDNGLRVGIIGIIGKDQITSICSQLVQTIGFKDPKEVVPRLSNKLRDELNCDIVVVSAHTGPETFLEDTTWDITQYANAVFCAHTHIDETYVKNGVPFIQGSSYGKYVSHVQLYVDSNGNVRCDGYSNVSYGSLSGVNQTVKNQVQTKIDNSNAQIAGEANEVLATLSGSYLNSSKAVPRLVAHAIAEYAESQGYDIELAMVNNARSSLQVGNITYTKLYEAIPFDNVVYIAKVSGYDLLNEAGYSSNSFWRVKGTAIQNSKTVYYTIAVIDYLLYHQNANRNYNYFASAFTSGFTPVALTKTGYEMYNYRYITRDFLREHTTITSSTYASNNDHTTSDLEKAITF